MGSSERAVWKRGLQFCNRRLARRCNVVRLAKFQRRGDKPMSGRVATPLGLQREKARHGQLVERFVPAPASIGDDLSDQGVEIDFPGVLRRLRRRVRRKAWSSILPGEARPPWRLTERLGSDRRPRTAGREIREGKLRLDKSDRPPGRFGKAIELGFAEARNGLSLDIEGPPAAR